MNNKNAPAGNRLVSAREVGNHSPVPDARQQLLDLLDVAVQDGTFVKLTLSRARAADAAPRVVLVRPVSLRGGPRLSFVFRHRTRDITKNFTTEQGLQRIAALLGADFLAANLFTTTRAVQLELRDDQKPRLIPGKAVHHSPPDTAHDRVRKRWIDPGDAPWLHALGVTTAEGRITKGSEAKFRQINKFVELLRFLLRESQLVPAEALALVDMGCGKGYLTFAAYDCLRRAGVRRLNIQGVEARSELVELCNRVAAENRFDGLRFEAGTIESASLDRADVLVALHACDTASDDAIAKGVQGGATLILVAPCCHKELRPQLRAPPVLARALEHGILRERQAEFVTDALRAALLEWAGYDTKVFEFVSTEHTAKNLMIAALKRRRPPNQALMAERVRGLAAFFGIQSQRLAQQLGFELGEPQSNAE